MRCQGGLKPGNSVAGEVRCSVCGLALSPIPVATRQGAIPGRRVPNHRRLEEFSVLPFLANAALPAAWAKR